MNKDTNFESKYYPKDYSIIPPSPDVSALLKYTEIPVNYFNGLPDINLPIYEIKEGTLTVPITLSYHGGGIKVEEKAGCVGLGWVLNAGGCISRTVYDHPDDLGSYDTPANGKFNATSNDKALRNYVIDKILDYDPLDFKEGRLLPIIQNNKNYEEGLSDMANIICNSKW